MVYLIFDMDGTIIEGDSWHSTNQHFGVENIHIYDYLNGRIDYERYLELVVEQWTVQDGGKVYYEKLEEAVKDIRPRDGFRELVEYAGNKGWKKGIISAGIDSLSSKISQEFKLDFALANGFEWNWSNKKRMLTGRGIPRVELRSKGAVLEKVTNGEPCIVIGDTKYDLPMFEKAAIAIAVNPRDKETLEGAGLVVLTRDLYPIIDYLEKIEEVTLWEKNSEK